MLKLIKAILNADSGINTYIRYYPSPAAMVISMAEFNRPDYQELEQFLINKAGDGAFHENGCYTVGNSHDKIHLMFHDLTMYFGIRIKFNKQ